MCFPIGHMDAHLSAASGTPLLIHSHSQVGSYLGKGWIIESQEGPGLGICGSSPKVNSRIGRSDRK